MTNERILRRRCATPDERYRRASREPDFLIVDLRRCRSYQELSWSTTERASDDAVDFEVKISILTSIKRQISLNECFAH